ncbi:MAG: restriction endonuclease [Peptostreptococcaceae bacterium]
MAKKSITNFTKQVTKQLIKEQNKNSKQLEKQQKEEYINNKYKEAAILTDNIDIHIKQLQNTINSNCKEITIEEFIKKDLKELSLPKGLLVPYTKPNELKIRKSNIIEKILKTPKEKYNLYVQETKELYNRQYEQYNINENNRISQIEALTKKHQFEINEAINTKKELYKNRDVNIISNYKEEILSQIEYPFNFRKCIKIGYCQKSKKLVIDYLLPNKEITPVVRRYEYKKIKDEIKTIPMNEKERNNLYNEVIFSIVLNSIGSVFKYDMYDNIDTVVFNGYIYDVDLATGQDISPYIVSAMIDKNEFNNIDIKRIDKFKCIKDAMQGRVDINSNMCFKEIIPIAKCDYINKSVINDDSINLLEVDPFVLESLVGTLFRNMGYEVIETNKTNDGGIDCWLYNNDAIMGGKVIGQVKRYKNNIDIPKLREFESVLRNSDAMKGIFISTSNFSTQCQKFALDSNITLIDGSSLVDYFNKYGISSYIQK